MKLQRFKKLRRIGHADHTRALEKRLVQLVRSGERAGVAGCRTSTGCGASRLDRNDRLPLADASCALERPPLELGDLGLDRAEQGRAARVP